MRDKKYPYILSLILLSAITGSCQNTKQDVQSERPHNILFIAVDDLRPQMGCYGNEQMKTPNMDKLASKGILFTRAYCNVPVCGASRASLLTGLRPTNTRFLGYDARKDIDAPEVTSLPQHFRENGYKTVSIGKIFHHPDDAVESWSEQPIRPDYPNNLSTQEYWRDYRSPENIWIKEEELKGNWRNVAGPSWECTEVNDTVYYDGKIAISALEKLKELSDENQPFFLAVGFLKPHLPFNAPKKYWDLYTADEIELAGNPFLPKDAPKAAYHNFGELRAYSDIPKNGPVPDSTAYKLIHGYYAATSYVDAQIGKLMDELKMLGLDENTIIILWGDHGWQLGEHGLWCKHSPFDNALRSPVIIKAPRAGKGKKIDQVVEYVDIYPTLCDLAGLDKPAHLEGDSWVPLFTGNAKSWKEVVYSRYVESDMVVTSRYIYTEWHDKQGELYGKMMYDHQHDPDENENIVDDERYAVESLQLKKLLDNQRKNYSYSDKNQILN